MGAFLLWALYLSIPQSKKIVDPPLESQFSTIESKANVLKPKSPYDETFYLCADIMNPFEWSACNNKIFKIVDMVNLNYLDKAIKMLQLSGEENELVAPRDDYAAAAESLRDSRLQFIKFRDSFCDSQYFSAGGSRRVGDLQSCMKIVTKQYTLFIWQAHLSHKWEPIFDDFPEPTYNDDTLY